MNKRISILGVALALSFAFQGRAESQQQFLIIRDGGGDSVPPPPPPRHVPPPPVFQPPPPPETPPTPPTFTPIIPTVFIDPLQGVDTTRTNPDLPRVLPSMMSATEGLQTITEVAFEKQSSGDENSDWILVHGEEDSKYFKLSPTTVKLESGGVLVSVRRPSKYALIQTPDGVVSLGADGDILASYKDGVLRLHNLSSRGMKCKIKLDSKVLGNGQAVALAPGYEMVASERTLTRSDLRPADGIARRGFSLLANGHVGVNEFSVESFLNSSPIVASVIAGGKDPKETRILNDMSKMAAVLNYINGSYGYTGGSATGLATKPGSEAK